MSVFRGEDEALGNEDLQFLRSHGIYPLSLWAVIGCRSGASILVSVAIIDYLGSAVVSRGVWELSEGLFSYLVDVHFMVWTEPEWLGTAIGVSGLRESGSLVSKLLSYLQSFQQSLELLNQLNSAAIKRTIRSAQAEEQILAVIRTTELFKLVVLPAVVSLVTILLVTLSQTSLALNFKRRSVLRNDFEASRPLLRLALSLILALLSGAAFLYWLLPPLISLFFSHSFLTRDLLYLSPGSFSEIRVNRATLYALEGSLLKMLTWASYTLLLSGMICWLTNRIYFFIRYRARIWELRSRVR